MNNKKIKIFNPLTAEDNYIGHLIGRASAFHMQNH